MTCIITLITENNKVCFTAYLSSDPGYNIPNTIVYDRVVTNKGSAYNTADGVFTAPRAGNFLFIWNSETNGNNFCRLYLYKNGKSVDLVAVSDARSANSDGGSMSVVLELTTGDRVWVRAAGCEDLYGGAYISFTGCQI